MSQNSALQEVQAAIYVTLVNDGLAGLVGDRIFDEVPASLDEFPYVHLAEATEQVQGETFSSKNRVVSLKINVWSRAEGWKEAQAILEELVRVLYVDLFLAGDFTQPTGWTVTDSTYVLAQEIRDPDGTRRIAATFAFSAEAPKT